MKVTEELKEMIEDSKTVVILTDDGDLRVSAEGVMFDVLLALKSALIAFHSRAGYSIERFDAVMDETKGFYKEYKNESKDCL